MSEDTTLDDSRVKHNYKKQVWKSRVICDKLVDTLKKKLSKIIPI